MSLSPLMSQSAHQFQPARKTQVQFGQLDAKRNFIYSAALIGIGVISGWGGAKMTDSFTKRAESLENQCPPGQLRFKIKMAEKALLNRCFPADAFFDIKVYKPGDAASSRKRSI